MNAITFLVMTVAMSADTGWVHTSNGSPRYQANYDGNNMLRGYSGPAIPQYSHADVYASQQPLDDLPDRPRIDTVPFADRSQLGWNTQRTGFDTPAGNRAGPGGTMQLGLPPNQGFPPNNVPNTGFNAPNNPGFTGANNPGFNAPNNMGFNGNGANNVPPLTPINPIGQPPAFGQNQFADGLISSKIVKSKSIGQNQFGSPNNPGFSNPPNTFSGQQPNLQGNPNGWTNTPNNGILSPPPTNRFNDPNFDATHGHSHPLE